jgi:hypothetical protein
MISGNESYKVKFKGRCGAVTLKTFEGFFRAILLETRGGGLQKRLPKVILNCFGITYVH